MPSRLPDAAMQQILMLQGQIEVTQWRRLLSEALDAAGRRGSMSAQLSADRRARGRTAADADSHSRKADRLSVQARWALGSLDTEEVTGSNPVSSTQLRGLVDMIDKPSFVS
ncbi:hypothetical protein GCM10010399_37420 [Dactylosporangium fulvum]